MHSDAGKIIDLYRRHAQAWTRLRGSTLRQPEWIDAFLKLLPNTPSVLDIGCGSGDPIGRYLLKNGCTLTGIDASPELTDIAKHNHPEATWLTQDMRTLNLTDKFDGLLAWHSTFHLTPDDQRAMFKVFQRHAAKGAILMFTSGTHFGEVIGDFQGDPLYHASLDPDEYRTCLSHHGFSVINHVTSETNSGFTSLWLAKFHGTVL